MCFYLKTEGTWPTQQERPENMSLIILRCMYVCAQLLCCVRLFATPRTVACHAPLSKGFSRQEYWSGLPFTTPGHLPDPGIEPVSFVPPALVGRFFITAPPGKLTQTHIYLFSPQYSFLPNCNTLVIPSLTNYMHFEICLFFTKKRWHQIFPLIH